MGINGSQLNWPELMLTSDFEAHRELLDLIEQGLRGSLKRKAEEIKTAARAAKDEEEHDELMSEVYGYEQESDGGQFMAIAFNSFFASSFALFEHTLFGICRRAQRDADCPIPVELLSSRNSVDNAKKYLEVLGIEFPSGASEWQEIRRYREIRNKIMHQGATLSEGNDLLAYAEEKQITSRWGERKLELTRLFCEEAIETQKQFILKTHRAYNRWRQGKSRRNSAS